MHSSLKQTKCTFALIQFSMSYSEKLQCSYLKSYYGIQPLRITHELGSTNTYRNDSDSIKGPQQQEKREVIYTNYAFVYKWETVDWWNTIDPMASKACLDFRSPFPAVHIGWLSTQTIVKIYQTVFNDLHAKSSQQNTPFLHISDSKHTDRISL